MVRLSCIPIVALCALSCATPQEPKGAELSVEQELAALIEKTNALKTFHVAYDMEVSREGQPGNASFEVVYRAPDLGCVHFESAKGDFDCWIVGHDMYIRANALHEGKWRRATVPKPSQASKILDELFPAEGKYLGPGVFFLENASVRRGVGFSLGGRTESRTYLLGWLVDMQRHSSEVSSEGDVLVRSGASHRDLVSRRTGFLERVELTAEQETVRLTLRECHIDEALDSALVTLPAEAQGAEEDPDFQAGLEQLRGVIRCEAFLRIEGQLASEKRTWNERTQTDWRAFLTALHREQIDLEYSDWLDKIQEYVDERVAWVHSQRGEDDPPDHRAEIEGQIDEARSQLVESLDEAETKYSESLSNEFEGLQPRRELLDVELDVIAKLYDELVREPALESFDQKLDAALEE